MFRYAKNVRLASCSNWLSLWLSLALSLSLSLSLLALYGSLWLPIWLLLASSGSLKLSLALSGSYWISHCLSLALYGFLWLPLWLPLAPSGSSSKQSLKSHWALEWSSCGLCTDLAPGWSGSDFLKECITSTQLLCLRCGTGSQGNWTSTGHIGSKHKPAKVRQIMAVQRLLYLQRHCHDICWICEFEQKCQN